MPLPYFKRDIYHHFQLIKFSWICNSSVEIIFLQKCRSTTPLSSSVLILCKKHVYFLFIFPQFSFPPFLLSLITVLKFLEDMSCCDSAVLGTWKIFHLETHVFLFGGNFLELFLSVFYVFSFLSCLLFWKWTYKMNPLIFSYFQSLSFCSTFWDINFIVSSEFFISAIIKFFFVLCMFLFQ